MMERSNVRHEAALLLDLFERAQREEASDIILTPGEPPRMRIAGVLRPVNGLEALSEVEVNRAAEALLGERYDRYDQTGQADAAYPVPDAGRLRVHVFRHVRGTGIALRLIPPRVWEPARLGLPPMVYTIAGQRPRGLFLVVGPTGSGKTTTIASMIDHLGRRRAAHVVTVEDPQWRALGHQREVQHPEGFAPAVWAALRQIPDVIVIGEARDRETISAALHAADSGHLVLATMHANGAPEAIERILALFSGADRERVRYQLALNLAGVIYQVLIPTGRPWRQLAYELLIATPAVRALIRKGEVHQLQSVMAQGGGEGMRILEQELARLASSGRIPEPEAERFARDPELYRRYRRA